MTGSDSRSSRIFRVFTLITFSGLGLLILLTVFALRRQAAVEAGNERQNAITRMSSAAAAFHQELPARLQGQPAILIRSSRPVKKLTIDTNLEPAERFLAIAAASDSDRLTRILEAAINADENERPFWWLLAVNHLADDRPGLAEPWVKRLIGQEQDWQLPGRPSVSNLAVLKLARGFARQNQIEKAGEWLKTLTSLTPLPESFKLQAFWGDVPTPPNWQQTFDLAEFIWDKREPEASRPGWHAFNTASTSSVPKTEQPANRAEPPLASARASETGFAARNSLPKACVAAPPRSGDSLVWFVFETGNRALAVPARQEWLELQRQLAEAAGPSFETTIRFDQAEMNVALPELPRAKVRLVPEQTVSAVESRWHLLLLAGVALALGGLLSMLFLFTRREQQAEIRASREDLYRQAAHDLKTPLTTLRALAETLSLGRTRDQAQHDRYLHSLMHEVDQAERVVDGMLLAARLEAGTVEPRCELIAPGPLVTDILRGFEPRLEGWKVQTDLKSIPVVWADMSLLKRVLTNLIENVLRHAYAGRELVIESRADQVNGSQVTICVADRGPGPTAPAHPSTAVDESLVRGSSRFGLDLVQQIMRLQNGWFELRPRAGGGTEAITSWPVEKESDHASHSDH